MQFIYSLPIDFVSLAIRYQKVFVGLRTFYEKEMWLSVLLLQY